MQSVSESLRLLLLQWSLSYNIILCPDDPTHFKTIQCTPILVRQLMFLSCVADDKSGVVQMIDK